MSGQIPASPRGSDPVIGATSREWTISNTYTLICLTLITTLNYLDRGLLGLLLPMIQQDLEISDTVLGLVSGLVFVVFYSTVGIPVAQLADRYNRKNIICIGLTVWSLMTTLTGAVTNAWQLAATRFLLGAGEASNMAPSHSMVSDLFSAKNRPLAIGVLAASSSIAALVFIPIAGWIALQYGWRMVFYVCGIPGIILAIIVFFTVREPPRYAENIKERSGFFETLRFLRKSRIFVLLTISECFFTINFYATTIWTSSFLARVHGLDIVGISATLGPLKGVVGVAGAVLSGFLVSRLAVRDHRWRLWVPAVAFALVIPGEALYLFSPSLSMALVGFAVVSMMAPLHQAPVFSVVMGLVNPRMRATALALLIFFSGLVGQIVGPLFVGMANDVMQPLYGEEAIRYSLALCVIPVLIASICIFAAAKDPMLSVDGGPSGQPTN